jgi:hypothetical protein
MSRQSDIIKLIQKMAREHPAGRRTTIIPEKKAENRKGYPLSFPDFRRSYSHSFSS